MDTSNLPSVEGLTPVILWYTLVGIVGICGLFLIFAKVAEVLRGRKERKEREKLPASDQLAKEIAGMVMEKIEKRLDDIDRKLSNDKNLLETHTRQILTLNSAYEDLQAGSSVQSLALVAILGHELHNGNADEMQNAVNELNKYLAKRPVYVTKD